MYTKKANPFDDPEAGTEVDKDFLLKAQQASFSWESPRNSFSGQDGRLRQSFTWGRGETGMRLSGTHLGGKDRYSSFLDNAKTIITKMRRTTEDEEPDDESPMSPMWEKITAFSEKALKVQNRIVSTTFMQVIFDIMDVVFYFSDIITDIQVIRVLHANGHETLMYWTIFFIVLQYFIMSCLVALYIQRTWGRGSIAFLGNPHPAVGLGWLLLAPLLLPFVPILDCLLVITTILALVFPSAYTLGSFLSNFNFSRIFMEFVFESIPQTILQAYIVLFLSAKSAKKVTSGEKTAVIVSLAVSAVNILKHGFRLHTAAAAAGMPLTEYFKYLLLLKGNYAVPKTVMDIQIQESCSVSGGALLVNGLHLHKNKSSLGPAQQAYILMTALDRFQENGQAAGLTKMVIAGCPLNAINRILEKGIKSLPALEAVEVNECAFRGETFNEVIRALKKHEHIRSMQLVQSGMLKKYRNHRCGEVVKLFKKKVRLHTLSLVVPWWDTPKMEKACRHLVKNRRLESLTIEFPRVAAHTGSTADLLGTADGSAEQLDTRYGGAVGVILQCNQTLTTLNLHNHNLDEESVNLIARALESNTTLQTLSLRGSHVGDKGAIALSRALKINPSLTSLNLRRCQVHGEGISALATMLLNDRNLRSLDLSSNRVLGDGVRSISRAPRMNSVLETLKIERWRDAFEDPESPIALGSALGINRGLRTLSLADCIVGDDGAVAIGASLTAATSLTSLDLSCPTGVIKSLKISDRGLVSLAGGLARSRGLQWLSLKGAVVGLDGARALGDALAMSVVMQHLDLSECDIEDAQLVYIAGGVARSRSLRGLLLRQLLDVGMEGMRALSTALRESKTLKTLDLAFSRLAGDDEVLDAQLSLLAGALGSNATLEVLSLAHVNRITDSGAAALAAVLSQNTVLKKLDLEGFSSEEAAVVFEEALKDNRSLQSLTTTNQMFSLTDMRNKLGNFGQRSKQAVRKAAARLPAIVSQRSPGSKTNQQGRAASLASSRQPSQGLLADSPDGDAAFQSAIGSVPLLAVSPDGNAASSQL